MIYFIMSLKIIQKDGSIDDYDITRIRDTLNNAFYNTKTVCDNLEEIIRYIDQILKHDKTSYNLEEIQDIVENALKEFKYYETATEYSSRKIYKRCIPKGSKVHTKNGLINIEDIIVGDEALTTDGYYKITDVINQGKQKVVKINTDNGYFCCTKNHKMAIYDKTNGGYNWKSVENLKKDDMLLNPKTSIEGNPDIKLPPANNNHIRKDRINIPEFDVDIAWLFGYCYGSATLSYVNNCNKIIICFKDEELLNKTKKILDKFSSNIHIIININRFSNSYLIELLSDNLMCYFREYIKSFDIPYFINETTVTNRIAYINGVIDSDITSKTSNNITTITDINFTNKWTRSFQTLCYSCGIQTQLVILKNSHKIIMNNTNTSFTTKIISIIDNQEEDTYDITVDNKHEFFCDGYLTHNSKKN